MISTIAALTFGGKRWVIDDKDSINTSFPIFFIKILGATLVQKLIKMPSKI